MVLDPPQWEHWRCASDRTSFNKDSKLVIEIRALLRKCQDQVDTLSGSCHRCGSSCVSVNVSKGVAGPAGASRVRGSAPSYLSCCWQFVCKPTRQGS